MYVVKLSGELTWVCLAETVITLANGCWVLAFKTALMRIVHPKNAVIIYSLEHQRSYLPEHLC